MDNKPVQTNRAVAKGTVVKKKPKSKFEEVFFPDGFDNFGKWAISEVIVPMVKDAVFDIFQAVWYPTGGGRSRTTTTKKPYHSYFVGNQQTQPQSVKPQQIANQPRKTYEYDDITYKSRGEAEAVLYQMRDSIGVYGKVRVADLYEFSQVSNFDSTASKYGWINLDDAGVTCAGRDIWMLSLPKALPIL